VRKLPPIPKQMHSPLGPIRVRKVDELKTDEGVRLHGRYRADVREIDIDTGATLLVQWQTLHHEWLHAVLCDNGLDLGVYEEPVIDTIATAILSRWLHERTR